MPASKPTSRLLFAVAAIAAMAVALSACGSSGSGNASGGSPVSTTHGASSSSNATKASSTAPAALSIGGGKGSFCSVARQDKKNNAAEEAAYTGDTPAELAKVEDRAMAELPVFAASAPSSIRPAVQVVIRADQKLFAVLRTAHFDVAKIGPSALASVETPAFQNATKTLAAYLTKVCHIPSSLPSR